MKMGVLKRSRVDHLPLPQTGHTVAVLSVTKIFLLKTDCEENELEGDRALP